MSENVSKKGTPWIQSGYLRVYSVSESSRLQDIITERIASHAINLTTLKLGLLRRSIFNCIMSDIAPSKENVCISARYTYHVITSKYSACYATHTYRIGYWWCVLGCQLLRLHFLFQHCSVAELNTNWTGKFENSVSDLRLQWATVSLCLLCLSQANYTATTECSCFFSEMTPQKGKAELRHIQTAVMPGLYNVGLYNAM